MARTRLRVVFTGEVRGAVTLLIRRALREAISRFPLLPNCRVDVFLCGNYDIHLINLERRGVDKPTDVLSFPMHDFYRGDPPMTPDLISPDDNRIMLGDIAISLDKAAEQAEEYGHSFERECAYLAVHGLLHLLGFDHEDEGNEKAAMRFMEESIMKAVGLGRNSDE